VLVVDDDTQFLDALVDTVNSLGYRAEGVSDCDAALSALRREPAEMVIADVSMPRMNGFDLLKVLKRSYPHMPVVMMTGHNLSEPAAATIRDHADAYLTKPFRRDRIKSVLSQLNPGG
jgi:DNA-binding NtrC family response regulator